MTDRLAFSLILTKPLSLPVDGRNIIITIIIIIPTVTSSQQSHHIIPTITPTKQKKRLRATHLLIPCVIRFTFAKVGRKQRHIDQSVKSSSAQLRSAALRQANQLLSSLFVCVCVYHFQATQPTDACMQASNQSINHSINQSYIAEKEKTG